MPFCIQTYDELSRMGSMRRVRGLTLSQRCEPRGLPKPKAIVAKAGLAYEKKVLGALKGAGLNVEHNPWFYFEDANGPGYCIPDILVQCPKIPTRQIIVECKLTYKEEALEKLNKLYQPVVSLATKTWTIPLVVAKNIIPSAPIPAFSFLDAIDRDTALLQWRGKGNII